MTRVFLDTSGWFAAMNPKEAMHRPALSAYRGWIEARATLVTTNLVVAEMQILLSRFRGADEGLRFMDSLYRDASHRVVFVDRDLERSATERWLRRFFFRDQRLTLGDAVSFEVMRTEGIEEALTLDANFGVAGFVMRP